MDIQSGKFKAPKDGYYIFTFSGTAYDPDESLEASVNVYKNEALLFDFDDFESEGTGQWRVISGSWMAKLRVGDTIHLAVDAGYLTTSGDQRIYFTGKLLLKSD